MQLSDDMIWHRLNRQFVLCLHLIPGVLNFSEWGFYYQLQAVAYPANASDPLLQSWIKPDLANPLDMNLPPGGGSQPLSIITLDVAATDHHTVDDHLLTTKTTSLIL